MASIQYRPSKRCFVQSHSACSEAFCLQLPSPTLGTEDWELLKGLRSSVCSLWSIFPEWSKRYVPIGVGFLKGGLSIFAGESGLGVVKEGLFGDVKAVRGEPAAIDIETVLAEGLLGDDGVALGIEAVGAVAGDEALVAGNDGVFGDVGILGEGMGTGPWKQL